MALLSLLNHLKHDLGIRLHVAHFNHRLRPTALRDQSFVEKTAKALSIPFSVGETRTLKNKTGSLEEAARLERLHFFSKVIKKTGFDMIALAHTHDDLAETILMRIIRGSGLQGLRAIQPCSDIDGLRVVRPLLEQTRRDVMEYLRHNKIAYKNDPTNRQLKFFRNKVRHHLLPLLEKDYNPNMKETLVKLSQTISADYDYIQRQTDDLFRKICVVHPKKQTVQLKITVFLKQPDSLRWMLLRSIYRTLKGDTKRLEQKHIHEAEHLMNMMPPGAQVAWPYGVKLTKANNSISFAIKE